MRVDVNELMGEMGWVRQLARSLLRDGDAANDVAQEAFLVANQHPPEDGRPLRPWLHRVVLNLVRMRGRGANRRKVRELAVGGDVEGVPTSDELIERVETQRVLAAEVIALAEPYRSTILLHYVEGLSSAEIARRLGIPSATVRRRLKHALDELRDRLRAREDGPKQGWLAALVPIARTNSHVAMGALAMKKLIAIAVVILLALLIGAGGWKLWRHSHGGDRAGVATNGLGGSNHQTRSLGPGSSTRVIALPDWLAQPNVAGRRVAGRVMAGDQVVPNATVRVGVFLGDPRRHPEAMKGAPPFAQIAVAQTTKAGEFDFGVMPAANIVVSAEADGKSPVSISVGLADPKTTPDHLILHLGECRSRMFGTVRDSAGPIGFARIKAAGLGGVTSDANGRYSLCWPATVEANFRVEADGYGSVYAEINANLYGELERDFTLVPEATIDGTVVDESGKPIAAATVDARNLLSDGRHEVATGTTVADAGGRFQLSGLAPAKYSLTAIADRFATDTHVVVVAVAGAASHDVRLVVQHRARITGRVMMQGTPVVGAQVTVARHVFSGRGESSADTQADGSFVLDGVQFGMTELHVTPYDVTAPRALKVDRDTLEVTIEVSPRASLYGQITRHHVPVTDAKLTFSRGTQTSAWTDASGNYHFVDLPAGNGVVLATNTHAWTSKAVSLGSGESQHLDLELDGGGAVRGTIVDEHGTAVPGVYMRLETAIGDDSCESMTDANGGFDCETLGGHADYVPRVFPSFAQQKPFVPAHGDKLPAIHVEDGDSSITNVRLAIKHDLLAIRGTVVDDTGAPVPDVHIVLDVPQYSNAQPSSARTDGDGAFTIENLAPGTFDLRAHASDGSEGRIAAVASGTSGVRIKLVRGGTVEGTLVGFTTPPWVFAEAPTLGEDMQDAIVSGDHFKFTGMPVGHYSISALVNGIQVDGAPVDMKPGAVVQVTLRTRPRATIEGRVVDFVTGTPIAGMTCRASVSIAGTDGPVIGGNVVQSSETDATGKFSVDAPIGRDRVLCFPSSQPPWSEAGGDFDVGANGAQVEVRSVKQTGSSDVGFETFPWTLPVTVAVISDKSPVVVGDQILVVDGVSVANVLPGAVRMLLANHSPGSTITLQVVRAGTPLTLRITAR